MNKLLSSFALLPVVSLIGCSSSAPAGGAPGADAGHPGLHDAGLDAADAADATPPPTPEPVWGGTTVEPGCAVDGCIHSFTFHSTFALKILAPNAAPGNPVLNGVAEYLITYVSDGKEITGSVFVPDSAPPAGGFGVVVMNQFTSGIGASCAPSAGQLSIGVASASALNGYLTLVPDATSYGTPPTGAYMVKNIAGRAALDGVRAAFHTSEALGKPVARKAIIAGLSQGAFSTMAAATELPTYAPLLEVRGFIAAEPPSNLRSGIHGSVVNNQVTIVYDAMRLYSWQGLLSLSGGQIFQPPFDTQAPGWFANECIFNGSDGSDGTLYARFPNNASTVLSPTFLGYAQNDTWPQDWADAYAASQTVPAGLKQPVLVFEGSADTVVLPAAADAYVAQLKAAGVTVDYRQIAGGTHGTTALSSFTVTQAANDQAIAWMGTILAN